LPQMMPLLDTCTIQPHIRLQKWMADEKGDCRE
jgi:hypothetical protein